MVKFNDKLFCTLASCENNIDDSLLTLYMYIFQMADFDINNRYKIMPSSFRSRQVELYTDTLQNEGYLNRSKQKLKLTDKGVILLSNYPLTYIEAEKYNFIKQKIFKLSYEEVYFIVLTDLVIKEVHKDKDIDTFSALVIKAKVINLLKSLTSNFTNARFDKAVKFITTVKKL